MNAALSLYTSTAYQIDSYALEALSRWLEALPATYQWHLFTNNALVAGYTYSAHITTHHIKDDRPYNWEQISLLHALQRVNAKLLISLSGGVPLMARMPVLLVEAVNFGEGWSATQEQLELRNRLIGRSYVERISIHDDQAIEDWIYQSDHSPSLL